MCSFEEPTGLCDWSQDDDDELDWEIGQGATQSTSTGPKRDHTIGLPSGYYIFLESSYPAVKNDRARIASAVMNSTGNTCEFRFYWHMYGEVSVHVDLRRHLFDSNFFFSQSGYRFT
jgi:hypothetical protein